MKPIDERPGAFSEQALEAWNHIPEANRQAVLSNVWCGSCGGPTTITAFQGSIEKGNLVLTGGCAKCGAEVARLIERIPLFTIGFAGRSAEEFFEPLKAAGVRLVVDIRLKNVSQLAGFTKRGDLPYFLDKLCAAKYLHVPELAPTKEIMDGYKSGRLDWTSFEAQFTELLTQRGQFTAKGAIPALLPRGPLALLCSESSPAHCHRRVVAEHAQQVVPNLFVVHL